MFLFKRNFILLEGIIWYVKILDFILAGQPQQHF